MAKVDSMNHGGIFPDKNSKIFGTKYVRLRMVLYGNCEKDSPDDYVYRDVKRRSIGYVSRKTKGQGCETFFCESRMSANIDKSHKTNIEFRVFNRTSFVGPIIAGKTYRRMEKLNTISDRESYFLKPELLNFIGKAKSMTPRFFRECLCETIQKVRIFEIELDIRFLLVM